MFDSILRLPIEPLALLTAVFFVGSYWIGCVLIRPILRLFVKSRGDSNDIVGYVLSAFGVFYGLLLGLIAVAAHQNLNHVESEARSEAAAIFAFHREVSDFPEPLRSQLRAEVTDYTRSIIEEEWPLMRRGQVPLTTTGSAVIRSMREGVLSLDPQTKREELVHAEAFGCLKQMGEHGRLRRYAAGAGIPSVMWYVVIVGAVINIAIFWLFDMRFITQLFLGGMVAFFLGALIMLIAVLDRPYRSPDFGVSPKAHELVLKLITRDAGGGAKPPAGKVP